MIDDGRTAIVVLDKYFGVNKQETETLLELGEASEMSNWMITDDLKLKKAVWV